ncbi:hypothetical protein [Aliiroseovarius marinus]|uniref:hypothetical protein n=1 Tax=Aliiroseovarius marinus TaxID=2500159 RepID=UPI0010614B71|nr:hypothetical protein [Aliiroseovarius marinus]
MNPVAILLLAIVVMLYGAYPTLIAFIPQGAVSTAQFLTIALGVATLVPSMLLVSVIMLGLFAGTSNRVTFKLLLTTLNGKMFRTGVLNAVGNTGAFGCLFFAIQGGAAVEASVLYELFATFYLIATMVFGARIAASDPTDPRKFNQMQSSRTTVLFFTIGAAGVILLGTSRHIEAIRQTGEVAANLSPWIFVAAICSPLLMAMSTWFNTGNGHYIKTQLTDRVRSEYGLPSRSHHRTSERVISALTASILVRGMSTIGVGMYWLTLGPSEVASFSPDQSASPLLFVVLCGVAMGFGGALSTITNNLVNSSNVNLMLYFEPFIAVLLLNYFGFVEGTHSMVFYGAMLVLTANFILTAPVPMSTAFRGAMLMFCVATLIVLVVPFHMTKPDTGLVGTILGLFGLIAAFVTDRLIRTEESRLTVHRSNTRDYGSIDAHNRQTIFVLWILGLGALVLVLGFRPEMSKQYDFFAVTISVAIAYLGIMPIDLITRVTETDRKAAKSYWSMTASALFILGLFILLLLALSAR